MQKREENSEFKVRRDFGEREKGQNQLLEVMAESYMILKLCITLSVPKQTLALECQDMLGFFKSLT